MTPDAPLAARLRLPLDQFDLSVDFTTTHRVTGIFGVSGAGKTSLLEALAGLRRPAEGTIRLGETVWLDTATGQRLPPEARGVGYVPQDSLLFPHLDVQANLHAGRRRARAAGHDFEQAFRVAVEVLELAPLLDRAVATLSGGERQRVALGRALCSGPRLLLLDEPFAALDAGLRQRVLPFLARVRDQFAVPMLLVSHDPVEVQALCDDLIVLRAGEIIARGTPRDVLTQPEVFPLAEEAGFENILPATLLETTAGSSRVRLGTDGPALVVPRARQPLGSRLLLSMPATEIILARARPEGLSARNILAATVEQVRPAGPFRLVALRVAPDVPALVAEVTAAAVEELKVAPGAALFLVIKASSFTLYE